MKQLTHKLKTGAIKVLEVPPPLLRPGMILVKNHYSLISAGTEGSTVRAARKSLAGKAKERPQQVKQVLESLRQKGPVQTYQAVMKRLDSYSSLGYSSAGEVIDVSPDVKGFAPGDLVACAGAGYASHAEVAVIPKNLCIKLHPDADLMQAAYTTIGAIALQGVRQAEVKIGETCAVIGLGLIGQLTCLILRAGGVKVVGVEIDPKMAKVAAEHCADLALTRDEPGIVEKIHEFTDGIGVDTAIITASSSSTDPVNFAGAILRKKGRVVIVGAVPTGFDRGPYYKKELELRMSCSYGPGRYDPNYEEKGIDYPEGYVRWTENRNMKAFHELVHSGKIDLSHLTTHVFELDKAPEAYDLILEKRELYLGILIKYDTEKTQTIRKVTTRKASLLGKVNIAFIGAGSYAGSYLLPNVAKNKDVALKAVMTSSGTSAVSVAEKYGFEFCTSDENDIFSNNEIDTIFITTRHDTHAKYVVKALRAEKNVFVEKPLCLTYQELEEIEELIREKGQGKEPKALMVGFNRRFSPLAAQLKERIGEGPIAMIYRVNAGPIPPGSWVQDVDQGGGRIIGEICHFVDFLTFANGSLPTTIFATSIKAPQNLEDTVNVSLTFMNGSIGTISYFSNGSKSLFKEYVEVYRAGTSVILKDFKLLEVYSNRKMIKKKLLSQDKGQKDMVKTFLDSIKNGNPAPISFNEIYATTLTTFKILSSLRNNKVENVS